MAGEPGTGNQVPTQTMPPAPAIPPAPVPAPETTQAPETPQLSLDMRVNVRDGAGTVVEKTLQNVVDGWRESESMSAEDKANYALFKKSISGEAGNTEAARELFDKLSPAAAPEAVPSAGAPVDDVSQLTERLAKVEQLLTGRVTPLMDRVDTASRTSQITSYLSTQKEKFPLLDRVGNGASMILDREGVYRAQAKKEGTDYESLPQEVRVKVLERCMNDVETRLKVLQAQLGGTPAAALAAAPGVVSLNDQTVPADGYKPPRIQVDQRGVVAPPVPVEPLPATPVTLPTGGTPGATVPQPAGPLTEVSQREAMRRRVTSLSGQ